MVSDLCFIDITSQHLVKKRPKVPWQKKQSNILIFDQIYLLFYFYIKSNVFCGGHFKNQRLV